MKATAIKRLAAALLALLTLASLAGCAGEAASDLDAYELKKFVEPIWDNDYVYCESALVLMDENGDVPPIQLLYDIKGVVSVRDFSLLTLYTEGVDYKIEDGRLVVLKDGGIYADIALAYDEYYFEEYLPGQSWLRVNGGATMMTEVSYGIGGLTDYQIAVTYTHAKEQRVQLPETKAEKLQTTLAKLEGGEKTNIVLLGDSISAGWSASGYQYCNVFPFCPTYYEMFAAYLAEYYHNDNINAANYSVGGMTSRWGAEEDQLRHVVSEEPDLVILAFGMNDGVAGGIDVPDYKSNTAAMIDGVRESFPQCEIILVSPMMPNSDIGGMLVNTYNYLEALRELENEYENVALADVSTVHVQLLMRKRYADMSGNNINHPNDFMHRVYAQVLLKTVIEEF